MIQRRKYLKRSSKPLKRTRLKKGPRRAARQPDPRFKDPRSHVTNDKRVRLYGEDMTDLRSTVLALSGERCEELMMVGVEWVEGFGAANNLKRCNKPITWETFHLMHGAHGHGFRNDVPRSKEHPDGCVAGCADCHGKSHRHY